jgi:amino acid transporter
MVFDEKNGTETDVECSRPSSYEGEGEEIKRDLKSRHINMIAIAGMIVRLICSESPIGGC